MNPEIVSIHIAFSMRRYFLCLWREHFKELFFNSTISFIHLESRHLTHCRLAHRLDVWTADSLKGSSFFLNFRCCSAAQSCPTLCDPMGCSTPALSALHSVLEFVQTHIHRVDDAIQPSHPLSPPSPPDLSLSQHQGLFR